jgi:hypothetical protein
MKDETIRTATPSLSYCNSHASQQSSLHLVADLREPELRLPKDKDLAGAAKAEIRNTSWNDELANEDTTWRPDIDAVATSTVDIPS